MCREQTKLRQCLLGRLRLSIGPFDRSVPKCNDTLALLGLEFLVAHCPEHPSQGLDIFWRSVLENVSKRGPSSVSIPQRYPPAMRPRTFSRVSRPLSVRLRARSTTPYFVRTSYNG